MKQKRIALLSFWSCPHVRIGILHSGGMNIYIRGIAKALAKKGYKVDIFTRSHPQNAHEAIQKNRNVKYIHIKSGKDYDDPINELYSQTRKFSEEINTYIKKNSLKYDALYSHYYFSGLVAIHLKEQVNVPWLHTFHTLETMKRDYSGGQDNRRFNAEKEIARCANKIVASTQWEKIILIKKYAAEENKIHVIPPGVDQKVFYSFSRKISREKLHIEKTSNVLLFVGRIDPVKGIDTLMEAIGKLQDKMFTKNLKIILIGGNDTEENFWQLPEIQKLSKFINKKRLSAILTFENSITHNKLVYFYNAADIVVIPSEFETFGLVALEAMSCGACVVASKIGGLEFLIKNGVTGKLFRPGESTRLADILLQLLTHRKQRLLLGKNAITRSKLFNWDAQVLEFESILWN